MSDDYSVVAVRELRRIFQAQKLLRPFRVRRYEADDILDLDATMVWPSREAHVRLKIDRFIGGGYAGQVYKVILLDVEAPDGPVEGLEKGQAYAMKILVPPKGLSRAIRNLIYGLGFQGAFSLQVNPDAVRAGALWQKFIRRAAKERFGSERAVVDILSTFVDPGLGSCGEISEWVDGRMWPYEIDDNLFERLKWKPGMKEEGLGSPEYRAKKAFMANLVKLMHDMGAYELARQYEWWTLKSQPNALKRLEAEGEPAEGLVAVDFRAGMVLLPFFPQCPADFKLILRGIGRGSLVQFDRGDLARLKSYVQKHETLFEGLGDALDDLEKAEEKYRSSLPDVTHHHIRLLTRPTLWKSISSARILGWKIRNKVDPACAEAFRKNPFLVPLFLFLGFLPVLTPLLFFLEFPGSAVGLWFLWLLPLLGPFVRKLWGRKDVRDHTIKFLTDFSYFRRTFRGRVAETLVRWHRSGRISEGGVVKIAGSPWRICFQLPLSFLPAGLHRLLIDKAYFRERLDFLFVRPFRLYFRTDAREKWLRDMIAEGEEKGMLRPGEAEHIRSQIKESFIQKYLKSLAVHVLTLPITQIVSLVIIFVYLKTHPELTWQQASVAAGLIFGFFQVTPISPGSFLRGAYTTFLVLKERNFKDYKIAFAISYLKYIGYLAFPLQMAYRYPELARFMAGHWATGAVHIVPIFGERGAWLEHTVFDLFYNYPLSLGQRIEKRNARNTAKKTRQWAALLAALGGIALLFLLDWGFIRLYARIPAFRDIWFAALLPPFLMGFAASVWSRKDSLGGRLVTGVFAGILLGIGYAGMNALLTPFLLPDGTGTVLNVNLIGAMAMNAGWRAFLFAILAFAGAFLSETRPIKG